jgi:hypothetical protein
MLDALDIANHWPLRHASPVALSCGGPGRRAATRRAQIALHRHGAALCTLRGMPGWGLTFTIASSCRYRHCLQPAENNRIRQP